MALGSSAAESQAASVLKLQVDCSYDGRADFSTWLDESSSDVHAVRVARGIEIFRPCSPGQMATMKLRRRRSLRCFERKTHDPPPASQIMPLLWRLERL